MKARMLVVLLLLTACVSGAVQELRDRVWRMTWVEGVAALPAGVSLPTVRFDTDGRFSGNTACNSAGASYTVDGERLHILPLLTTKRACTDREGTALERAYLAAIERTRSFRIENDELQLLSAEGRALARFR